MPAAKTPTQVNRAASWAHALAGALRSYASGVYVNSLEDEGDAPAREAFEA
jgi:hypothetical protein